MGQILGLGVTHFPPLSGTDENLGRILKRALICSLTLAVAAFSKPDEWATWKHFP